MNGISCLAFLPSFIPEQFLGLCFMTLAFLGHFKREQVHCLKKWPSIWVCQICQAHDSGFAFLAEYAK